MKGLLKLENGNEMRVEITDEGLLKLLEAEKPAKLTGWERVKEGASYFFIQSDGIIEDLREMVDGCDNTYYEKANYFSTKEKAEEVAFETELFRKLKRFADENNEQVCTYNDRLGHYYLLSYIPSEDTLKIVTDVTHYNKTMRYLGVVYFSSYKIAEKALETFRPELEKYYGINQK